MSKDLIFERDVFSFTWTIEEFSHCPLRKDEMLMSPNFTIDSMGRSQWCLMLYPKGYADPHYMDGFLGRVGNAGPEIAAIGFNVAVLKWDGTAPMLQETQSVSLGRDDRVSFQKFVRIADVWAKDSGYILNDTLTLRCRMWRSHVENGGLESQVATGVVAQLKPEFSLPNDAFLLEEMHKVATEGILDVNRKMYPWSIECSATTKFQVEKRFVLWAVTNFSTRKPNFTTSFKVDAATKEDPALLVTIYFSPANAAADCKVCVKIVKAIGNRSVFAKCMASILDYKKNECESVGQSHYFGAEDLNPLNLPGLIERRELIAEKDKYLRDDVLFIKIETSLSSGSHSLMTETRYTTREKPNLVRSEIGVSYLRDNLFKLSLEDRLCDVALTVGSRSILMHKAVLCSWSEVFATMFETDMRERDTNEVKIEEFDFDTVAKMVNFMYTETVEEKMPQNALLELYKLAHKYGIHVLKSCCSYILVTRIQVANVCQFWVVADLHMDEDLKVATETFICTNARVLMRSPGWKKFLESNMQCACDIMQLVCMKRL